VTAISTCSTALCSCCICCAAVMLALQAPDAWMFRLIASGRPALQQVCTARLWRTTP
jgi:hypothetical protein